MADIENGSLTQVRIPDGAGGSMLRWALALGPADIGEDSDFIVLADDAQLLLSYTLTATAALPSEARKTSAGNQATAVAVATFAAAVLDKTPLTWDPWRGNGLWVYDAEADKLSITTNQVRTQRGSIPVQTAPLFYDVVTEIDVTVNVTAEFYIRGPGISDEYPLLPDLAIAVLGDPARQKTSIDLSPILWPLTTGAGLRIDLITKGNAGGGLPYALINHSLRY